MKSGKSGHAEAYALKRADGNIAYLATSECLDEEMASKIAQHKQQRNSRFITIEEPLSIAKVCDTMQQKVVLVECISMWINNMLHYNRSHQEIFETLRHIGNCEKEAIFVINDVNSGIIPENALAREFVMLNGKAAQELATACDNVYHCIAGIATCIKGSHV